MARIDSKRPRTSSTSTPAKRHRADVPQSSSANRPKRQASRASIKSTPTKSEYFSQASDSDGVPDATSEEEEQSGYEDEDASALSSSNSEAEESAFTSEEEDKPKKRGGVSALKSRATLKSNATASKKDVWKPGVKSGLGPGTQVIIKKPKARPAGKTPYQDDALHPNTMAFLADLKANNSRQWLKLNDPDFRQSEQDWKTYVEKLTEKIAEIDETVPELPVKDVVFRIYRDVRFSKDQTPYKTHFSAAWSRTGRKGPYAAYYVQIQPGGGSLVAGGLWMPEAAALATLRRAIDRHPERLKDVLQESRLRKDFLKGVPSNEAKVVKAFCDNNASSALKTRPKRTVRPCLRRFSTGCVSGNLIVSPLLYSSFQAQALSCTCGLLVRPSTQTPTCHGRRRINHDKMSPWIEKGYDADHKDIGLLRLRSFTLGRRLQDTELVARNSLTRISELISSLEPFITYLNSVVMPDHADAESSSDEEDDDDDSDTDGEGAD